jgi:hypothetical protein
VLNNEQILTLAEVGKMKVRCCDGIPIAIAGASHREIKYPYELFREKMGLDDLRLNWLLGTNNMIAGGSVLNWIWGENTNGDIDFFFKDEEYADIFVEFIKGIGFKLTAETGYAATYFEPLQGLILQVVGNTNRDPVSNTPYYPYNPTIKKESDFEAYGTPQKVIDNFDFHICKFAVDADYLYTTSRAIQDLLKLTIDNTRNEKRCFLPRILKYNHKGFFLSPSIKRHLKYDKPPLQDKLRKAPEWP